MSGPAIHIGLPSWDLFKFPPDPAPPALPPPSHERTFAHPFPIDFDIYNELLDVKYPVTIAAVYAVSVTLLNAYNKKRGNKPWSISKTLPFKAFVILHNVFLALYSAATFAAMVRAMRAVLPGLHYETDLVRTVDALCKLQGPRGYGDAVTYNSTTGAWGSRNKAIRLGDYGTPDPTDLGRLWNEGLAFWGWWFYLSKFYEVLDTVIILAKGKRSSTLQTYHHAGAMLCMWAGIRYMSPPIWLFCLFNSGIHALMYTYYTVSALRIRVPQAIKRTLTSLQISQFVIGASLAAIHLFVHYTVPVSTPYRLLTTVTSLVAAATSTAAQDIAAATASPHLIPPYLRKLAFRAAGSEGLAENVLDQQGHVFGPEADRFVEKVQETWKQRDEYQWTHCLDTTGQAFAVWLNVMYLLPLTVLFVRFFVKSYSRRYKARQAAQEKTHLQQYERDIGKSIGDARHGVEKEVEHLGQGMEDGVLSAAEKAGQWERQAHEMTSSMLEDITNRAKREWEERMKSGDASLSSSQVVQNVKEQGRVSMEKVQEKVERALRELKETETFKHSESSATDADENASRPGTSGTSGSGSSAPDTPGKKKNGNKKRNKKKAESAEGPVVVEKDVSAHAPEGLSTTDPREVGESYAKVVKE